jgi:vancomycin resistance protein YoaR
MTSRSDPISLPFPGSSSARFLWRRAGFTFLVSLLAIVVFGASFGVGYARIHDGRVLPGVDVGGVGLAGLDRNEAEREIRATLPSLSSGRLVIDVGGVQETLRYAGFGRDYDMEYMLGEAMGVGRGPNLIEQLQEQLRVLINGMSVSTAVTWDESALTRQVAAFAMSEEWDSVSATITRDEQGRYVVTPAVDGQSVDVEGAVTAAFAAVNNVSAADTQIMVNTAVVPPAVSTAEAQAAADIAERVIGSDLTVAAADLSTTINSDVLRGWVHLDESPNGGDWQLVIERAPIAQFVANYGLETDIAPKNASFRFQGGDVTVVDSSEGRSADVEATTNNILAALEGRATGGGAGSATLALVAVPPTFNTADARAIAPRVTKLSEWTTKFIPSPLNGEGVNIQIPTDIIDGYVVEPGAMFDFLAVIGPITSPPYVPGAAIRNNRTIMDGVLGGGMCSCSTTVFNAAMRAGLDIGARRNHSYYISRYPVGLDATVWIASANSKQTMSFVNDNPYPVLIRGINRTGEVTFQVWGVDDGRTVELSEPRVEREKSAREWIEYTNELSPGVRKRTEFTVDGFWSWVTRTVRDRNGNVIHEDVFHSRYKTIDGVIQVGRYPGDPKAGTRVLASEYVPSRPRTEPPPEG